ncbi:MAG: Chemotaxis protein methyltransferase [Candidatus Solibacter sp.]|nr:Chemotaxis protein methyltransferase [Candidatus Solibacter sp.]
MDAIIADLTIGETYFFRDREQFDAIRDVVIPEILERKQSSKRLRIWSAGCANGSEPYSLAILLARELGHRLDGWHVSIFATDINRQSLAEAQAGRFQEWALRSTLDTVRQECFAAEGRGWVIHPEYKEWITFEHMNLVEHQFPTPRQPVSHFDLILCRNVMIYFAPDVIHRLIRQFHESLTDGGWFVAGVAEHNMQTFSCFDTVGVTGATVYRKSKEAFPKTGTSKAAEPPGLLTKAAAASLPQPILCARAARNEGFAPPEIRPPTIDELRRFADRGDWDSAIPCCNRLLAQDGLNPVVHFYHAMLLEQTGQGVGVKRSLRRAVYLDRNFLLAHYYLGLALAKGSQPRPAAHSLENVLKLAAGLRDEQAVEYGDGLTVAGLKQLAKMHLQNLGVS